MSTKIPKIKVTQEEKKPEPKEVAPIRKERLSIEEKKYKRELDIALAESMKDSQSGEETKEIVQLSEDESTPLKQKQVQKKSRLEDLSDEDENKAGTNKENENIESQQGMSHEEVAASINQDKEESKTISSTEQEESKSDNEADNEEDNIDDGYGNDDISGEAEDDDEDDSDFDEKKERNPQNKQKSEQTKSSPSKVGIKPRISVTVTPLKMLKSQARRLKQGSPKGSSKSVSSVDSSSATNSPQSLF